MSILADVDRGLAIVKELAGLKTEWDAIQKRLQAAALKGRQIPLEDKDREGKQFLATGTTQIVPVIITSDALIKSFQPGSKQGAKIANSLEALVLRENPAGTLVERQQTASEIMEKFYPKVTKHECEIGDGKVFRDFAVQFLGAEAAPGFISACLQRDKLGIPKNQIKIEWDRAKEIPAVPSEETEAA